MAASGLGGSWGEGEAAWPVERREKKNRSFEGSVATHLWIQVGKSDRCWRVVQQTRTGLYLLVTELL